MPYATTTDGHRIHYTRYGTEGPVVVLVMGIGVPGSFWGPVPTMLTRDAARPLQVLVVDNRGTGQSDLPARPFRVRDMADDVAVVLDHAGVQLATVVGISLGGMIAQHVAIRHPARVRSLGLLCTTPGLPLGLPPSPRALKRLITGFAQGMRGRDFLRLMYPDSQIERALERLRTPEFGAHFRSMKPSGKTFAMHLLAASLHTTSSRELRSIRCPTVIVTGADDLLIPPVNSRRLHARIANSELRVLPDVGHDIMTLAPEAICECVHDLAEAQERP